MRNANSTSATRSRLPRRSNGVGCLATGGKYAIGSKRPASGPSTLMCFLPGDAGGCDLPAKWTFAEQLHHLCLHGVAFRPIAGPAALRQPLDQYRRRHAVRSTGRRLQGLRLHDDFLATFVPMLTVGWCVNTIFVRCVGTAMAQGAMRKNAVVPVQASQRRLHEMNTP